jgi:hypothetical protein
MEAIKDWSGREDLNLPGPELESPADFDCFQLRWNPGFQRFLVVSMADESKRA